MDAMPEFRVLNPATVDEARANPRVFAGKSVGQVTSHMAEAVAAGATIVRVGTAIFGERATK